MNLVCVQVLEPQNVDPSMIQMTFLDDVVHSLLKGENIGITSRRRSRSSQNNNTAHVSIYTYSSTCAQLFGPMSAWHFFLMRRGCMWQHAHFLCCGSEHFELNISELFRKALVLSLLLFLRQPIRYCLSILSFIRQ